jgi:hypothetical protein
MEHFNRFATILSIILLLSIIASIFITNMMYLIATKLEKRRNITNQMIEEFKYDLKIGNVSSILSLITIYLILITTYPYIYDIIKLSANINRWIIVLIGLIIGYTIGIIYRKFIRFVMNSLLCRSRRVNAGSKNNSHQD